MGAGKDNEATDHYPAYPTEKKVMGEHMALFLAIYNCKPGVRPAQQEYNIHSLATTYKDLGEQKQNIAQDPVYAARHRQIRNGETYQQVE